MKGVYMSIKGKLILVCSFILNILLIVSVSIYYINTKDTPTETWGAKQQSEQQMPEPMIKKKMSHSSAAKKHKPEEKLSQQPPKPFHDSDDIYDKVDLKRLINSDTINYFKHLSVLFPGVSSMDGHFDKIYEYLLGKYPKEQADALFKTYKKYFKCETDLKYERVSWGTPKTADDWLAYLKRTYDFRLNSMGDNVGALLFGEEYKQLSYKIKKTKIIKDDSLYGADKEKFLEMLASETYGDQYQSAVSGDVNTAFDMYKLKLDLYKKDFEEMTEEEKKAKINEFRNELLSPELVSNLEAAEKKTAEGKKRYESYKEQESSIMQDPDLDDDQKAEQIKELQNNTFKGYADAFRRGQALRQATQEAANKLKNKQ
jgi:lipase chaperone LimK